MHTLTAKITKAPRTFQAGEYTGFNMLLGKQYYDRQTKTKVWTNYKVCLFAKDKQAAFYQQALIVGAVVEVSAEDCKVDLYNPEYPNIEFIDAKLGNVFSGAQNQNNAPQQQQPQQQQQNQNNNQRQSNQMPDPDMSDDIPF